jgi:aminoglycoside 6'-N-acetyltransferase
MSPYRFSKMTEADLPLIKHWLEQPHVVEWWGSTHEQFGIVSGDLTLKTMDQFIVSFGDRPFGYIQCYDLRNWPDGGLGDHPPGTLGIDQFIGEADMVNRGHGSIFIKAFVDARIADGAPRIITDPDPANERAIRAYEKAGLRRARLVHTSEGVALLMTRDA